MRSKESYEKVKQDTILWKKRHKARTRHTQYKTYTKHFILHANRADLKKVKFWLHQRLSA